MFMLSDRLDTFDPLLLDEVDVPKTRKTRLGLQWLMTLLAVAAYEGITVWLLSSNTARVYGFPISHDPRTTIEIALQICPMLAAIFLVLLSPVLDRPGRGVGATVMMAAASGFLAVCATATAVVVVCGARAAMPRPATLFWVAGELMFDVTMIAVFTTALHAVSRKLWVTASLFIAYVVFVSTLGARWGITSYIGFASSVTVALTTYSIAPLYDAAGWLLRMYWAGVTVLLLALLHTFDRPARRKRSLIVCACLFVLCVAAACSLWRLQQTAIAGRQGPPQALAVTGEGRLQLSDFQLGLTFRPENEEIAVSADLTLASGAESIQSVVFEAPGLIIPDQLQFTGAGPYRIRELGKYRQVTFDSAIPAGQTLHATYSGSIRSAGPFDLTVQAKVLSDAFFLTDSDLLLAPRRASCIGAMQNRCNAAENYLLSDRATRSITVVAPARLSVVTTGQESRRDMGGGSFEHTFRIATPRLSTFVVACAAFRKSVAISRSGSRVQVFRSAAGPVDGDPEAALARDIVSFYQGYWPADSAHDLNVIEMPTPLGEAIAFDGAIALSDKIIGSRNPGSGAASNLLQFVMAHEIAHQWWGYRVVPSRSPGRMFLLESLPQFAAYQYLSGGGILSEDQAIGNEKRRYRAARARLGKHDVPLAEAETGDEIAYNKGPFALLSLDSLADRSLMRRLGGLIQSYSSDAHGNTLPRDFEESLIRELPESRQTQARELLYGVGIPGRAGQ
jgi:hypothetical protein